MQRFTNSIGFLLVSAGMWYFSADAASSARSLWLEVMSMVNGVVGLSLLASEIVAIMGRAAAQAEVLLQQTPAALDTAMARLQAGYESRRRGPATVLVPIVLHKSLR